ncbi:hypothetical protein FQZ97_1244340 [compost metagenome]
MVDFLGRFPHEEKTTGDQNNITPGETMIEGVEDRFFKLHDDRDRKQQCQTQNERCTNANAPCFGLQLGGKLIGQNRYENKIVDAKDDFHRHQRDQCGPSAWA